jgi:hypothetical protein
MDSVERLRKLCLAMPEAHEVESWGEPTFRVKNKIFAMYAASGNHHGAGREAVWCKAKAMTQDMLMRAEPERYFAPPYVGPKGWVGVWLDRKTDWDALHGLLEDAYRLTAAKKLVARMNETGK